MQRLIYRNISGTYMHAYHLHRAVKKHLYLFILWFSCACEETVAYSEIFTLKSICWSTLKHITIFIKLWWHLWTCIFYLRGVHDLGQLYLESWTFDTWKRPLTVDCSQWCSYIYPVMHGPMAGQILNFSWAIHMIIIDLQEHHFLW